MDELAELLVRDLALAYVLSGGIVFVLLEIAKLAGWSDSGEGKLKKILTAVVVAAIVTAARQHVAEEWNVADLIGGTVAVWLVAAGIHGTKRAQIKSEAVRIR